MPLIAILLTALAIQGTKPLLLGDSSLTPSSAEVSVSREGASALVFVKPGKDDYPGVALAAPGKAWDLSKFGHVEARLTNRGAKPITLSLRVDNAGDWRDNPWNAESVTLAPGQSGAVTAIFGYSYGHKPGYRLKPSSIPQLLLFASKSAEPQAFSIESIVAAGPAGEKPPVAPEDVRVRPLGGILLESPMIAGTSLTIGAKTGRWDLRDKDGIRFTLHNPGATPARVQVRVESNGGPSAPVAADIPPGKTVTVDVPFAGSEPYDLDRPDTQKRITSDAVRQFVVESDVLVATERVVAVAAPANLPAWVGKRPPVAGEWTKTLDEEFDGKALDRTVWKTEGENYYDKVSHWSRENAVLGGGAMRLRFEKRRGHHNDDPKRPDSDYAVGYLDTFGLWRQRYGYFEARMKIPAAPGLWPAFWMMPDRGPDPSKGEQWQRQDTGNGGMEFDIMENLTRWGDRRYNIAMHYDGYQKEHKAVGSDRIYVQPDKEGFLTCGLLWTPGEAVYYCNGREVLRWKSPRVSNVPSILMFTLPSGGWDNDALDDAKLPSDFVIDYVRVWQRKDLASAADGKMKAR